MELVDWVVELVDRVVELVDWVVELVDRVVELVGLVVELSVECTGSWIMVNKQALGTTLKIDSYKLSSLIVAVYSFTAVLGVFADD